MVAGCWVLPYLGCDGGFANRGFKASAEGRRTSRRKGGEGETVVGAGPGERVCGGLASLGDVL